MQFSQVFLRKTEALLLILYIQMANKGQVCTQNLNAVQSSFPVKNRGIAVDTVHSNG